MTTKKILLTTLLVVVVGTTAAFAFKKRKHIKKLVGKVFTGDTSPGAAEDDGILKAGSLDEQHITQLQEAINELHAASQYINTHCQGIQWPVLGGKTAGPKAIQENGVFDAATEKACQFYFNRTEVEPEFLNSIRTKLAKYQAGSKCQYPLSY